jgi:hypothetical protein
MTAIGVALMLNLLELAGIILACVRLCSSPQLMSLFRLPIIGCESFDCV